MKGFRTLAVNGGTVLGVAALNWAAGVDWTQHVSPTAALMILGGINLGLRLVTTTPVGRK